MGFTVLYISLPSSAQQQREMTKFYVFSRTWAHDGKVFFLFPCFNAVHSNLVPGQFVSILQVKQISIISKASQKREVIFLNHVFVAVAVVVAKTPYCCDWLTSDLSYFRIFISLFKIGSVWLEMLCCNRKYFVVHWTGSSLTAISEKYTVNYCFT